MSPSRFSMMAFMLKWMVPELPCMVRAKKTWSSICSTEKGRFLSPTRLVKIPGAMVRCWVFSETHHWSRAGKLCCLAWMGQYNWGE